MPREDTLLASVQENPDGIANRLAYAEWCDEYGQHQKAEYLRLAVEFSQKEGGGDPHFRRFLELHDEMDSRWLLTLRGGWFEEATAWFEDLVTSARRET